MLDIFKKYNLQDVRKSIYEVGEDWTNQKPLPIVSILKDNYRKAALIAGIEFLRTSSLKKAVIAPIKVAAVMALIVLCFISTGVQFMQWAAPDDSDSENLEDNNNSENLDYHSEP